MKFKIDIENVNPKDIDALFEELETSNNKVKTCDKYGASIFQITNNDYPHIVPQLRNLLKINYLGFDSEKYRIIRRKTVKPQ